MKCLVGVYLMFCVFTECFAGSISGVISWPDNGPTSEPVNFSLTLHSSVSNFHRSLSVEQGATSASFEVNGIPEDGHDYVISYKCRCNEGFESFGFLSNGGTTRDLANATRYDQNGNYSNLSFLLPQGETKQLTVRIPEGAIPRSNAVTIDLKLDDRLVGAYGSGSKNARAIIPAGETSATVLLHGFVSDYGYYPVYGFYECIETCSGLIDKAYIGDDAMAPRLLLAAEVDLNSTSEIEFQLVAPVSLSGQFTIPNNYQSLSAPSFQFQATQQSTELFYVGGNAYTATQVSEVYSIDADNKLHFEIDGLFPTEGSIVLRYECFSNCDFDNFLQQAYFSNAGAVWSQRQATDLEAQVNHEQLDWSVGEYYAISGQIVNAGGAVENHVLGKVRATMFGLNGEIEAVRSSNFSIAPGASSANYTVSKLPPLNADYTTVVSYELTTLGHETVGYYSSSGTVYSISEASKLPVLSDHSNIDLDLDPNPRFTISGSIKLPNDEVAIEGLNIQLYLRDHSHTNQSVFAGTVAPVQNLLIQEGDSEVEFEFTNLDYPAGYEYALGLDVGEGSVYVRTGFYNVAGLEKFSENATAIPAGINSSDISVELLTGSVVQGVVSLRENYILPDQTLDGRVTVESYDQQGRRIDFKSAVFEFNQGGVAQPYLVDGLWSDPDGFYKVRYGCSFNCALYESRGYVTSQGTVTDDELWEELDFSGNPQIADVEIIETHTNIVNTIIKWPENEVGPEDSEVYAIYYIRTARGSSDSFSVSLPLPAGENSVQHEVRFPSSEEGGTLQIAFGCSRCGGGLGRRHYYAGPDSFSFHESDLAVLNGSIDQSVVLEISQGIGFEGTVYLSDSLGRVDAANVHVQIHRYDAEGVLFSNIGRNKSVAVTSGSVTYAYLGFDLVPGGFFKVGLDVAYPVSDDILEHVRIERFFLSADQSVSDLESATSFSAEEYQRFRNLDFFIGDPSAVDGDRIYLDDNCPLTFNPAQLNFDGDAFGDVCDPDIDNDNVLNREDSDEHNEFVCSDFDLDMCEDCSSGTFSTSNDGRDTDRDGVCNLTDLDDDNDSVLDDAPDNCPFRKNPGQEDVNSNGIGDVCEYDLCFPVKSRQERVAFVCL